MAKPLGDQCKVHAMLVKVHGPAVAQKMRMDGTLNFREIFLDIISVLPEHLADGALADVVFHDAAFCIKQGPVRVCPPIRVKHAAVQFKMFHRLSHQGNPSLVQFDPSDI